MHTQSVQTHQVERKWHVVDATDQPLGRLASEIAKILRGKHRPEFTPNADCGDFVVVINAEKVRLTGNKMNDKRLQTHSGIPGGFKNEPYRLLMGRRPTLAIEKAVHGMLPKTKLGRKLRTKLKVYAGPSHPHAAQKPEPLNL
ncbi:MAG TPA: 50S ribosomal protein L13 [Sandaracinaceae bacterium LLY-WYZ-13_1]|nr:50S ribosomal protein L13 [Sandaracinaceae bacterium LLY-WYZ-13_1]